MAKRFHTEKHTFIIYPTNNGYGFAVYTLGSDPLHGTVLAIKSGYKTQQRAYDEALFTCKHEL